MNDDCSDKMTGVCKWFDKMRGYGFIQELSTGNDFFVHYSLSLSFCIFVIEEIGTCAFGPLMNLQQHTVVC